MLERGRDVDLLAALGHAVEHHVDEDVGARAADAVAAVHADGAGAAAVRLVHLAAELEQGPAICKGDWHQAAVCQSHVCAIYLVDGGVPCVGHDLKWNCVTVRVSPERVFLR